ncbi:hypothetical protein GCM10027036_34800 [Flavihumibacter cheonanensis]|uniref:hypothetical protein n=1 Tax=Flavihumibacter cheonanensis TaxID=1442385 RepID=UPI001EF94CB1|nr:hypothetical protein [Flavihumibacter cheonanensis]MCG7753484.1 hypothetical protein [Flavihumibacter cheonanensis]
MDKTIRESVSVTQFLTYTVTDLLRQELGVKSFQEVEHILSDTKRMLDEMISIAESHESIPIGLKNLIFTYINEFNVFAAEIKNYNIDNDPSNFQLRNRIITNIQNWYLNIFQGFDNNRNINNFLQVYNSLKIHSLLGLQKDKAEIDKLKEETETANKKANEVISLLQSKASAETVQDYATIFQMQSLKHSNFIIGFKPLRFRLGNAEVWLFISLIQIFSFGLLVVNINRIFPIDFSNKPSIVTVELITRILIISFSIYLISFAFKQYNIQKHLHTLNRHRQNTLNSFKLFIESLDANDIATRNALMMEVAKAIYESGQSGFISGKESTDNTPSIIEMTRFVNQK